MYCGIETEVLDKGWSDCIMYRGIETEVLDKGWSDCNHEVLMN